MSFPAPDPKATRIYFDEDDEQIDGFGWNVVTGDEAIAARFPTLEVAEAAFVLWG